MGRTITNGELGESVRAKLNSLIGNAISVKDPEYGATGDGSTDDYAAVQAAATAAAGGVLVFPEGVYAVSQDVSIPANTTIYGYGATLFARSGNTSNPVLITITTDDVRVIGLKIDGNLSNHTTFNNVVTSFQANRVVFENCEITNCRGIALLFSECKQSGARNCWIHDTGILNRTTSQSSDRKQAIAYTGGGEDNFVEGCYIWDVGLDCISFAGGEVRSRAHGNNLQSNDAGTLYVSQTTGAAITGNIISNGADGGNGIDIINSTGFTISANRCVGNGAAGIGVFSGCSNGTITGNVCLNNHQNSGVHRGGITFGVSDDETISDILVDGNVCADTQGTGNVTQRFAIGVYDPTSSGVFERIRITEDNILKGYDTNGDEDVGSIYQLKNVLGAQSFPVLLNLADSATMTIGPSSARGEITVSNVSDGNYAKFYLRPDQAPLEITDTGSAFATTDTGSDNAVYYDSGDSTFKLKNRTGGTQTYFVRLNWWGI